MFPGEAAGFERARPRSRSFAFVLRICYSTEIRVNGDLMRYTTSKSMLDRIRDGDDDHAWAAFYEKYRGMIVAIGRRRGLTEAECDDLLQETLTIFWQRLDRFVYQPEKGKFRGYLSRMAGQIAARIRDRRLVPVPPMPEYDSDVDGRIMHEWEDFVLGKALDELKNRISTESFEAFYLSAVQGIPVRQVAAVTGKTPNNIYNLRSRCLAALREILREIRD